MLSSEGQQVKKMFKKIDGKISLKKIEQRHLQKFHVLSTHKFRLTSNKI